MKLHRLKPAGIERMHAFLDSLTTDSPQPRPNDVLQSPLTAEPVTSDVEVEERTFANRFDAATYLDQVLDAAGLGNPERDVGVWSWLSLFYFEQLCPAHKKGRRKPGERARWIPQISNFRKYYRHLLAGPWRAYRAHREQPRRTLAVLCGPLDKPGEVAEQLTARQELVSSKAVMQAATTLYYDPVKRGLRRGAAGQGPGSARRLADILNQLDLTWDINSMAAPTLLSLLPAEFNRFRQEGDSSGAELSSPT